MYKFPANTAVRLKFFFPHNNLSYKHKTFIIYNHIVSHTVNGCRYLEDSSQLLQSKCTLSNKIVTLSRVTLTEVCFSLENYCNASNRL